MEKRYSIRGQLRKIFTVIIVLLSVPTIAMLFSLASTTSEYNRRIGYISGAQRIIDLSSGKLINEMWEISAGTKRFEDGDQEQLLREISEMTGSLDYESGTENVRRQVDAAKSIIKMMEEDVEVFRSSSYQYSRVKQRQESMDELKKLSGMLEAFMQKYINLEIGEISANNQRLMTATREMFVLTSLLLMAIVLLCLVYYREVSRNIHQPLSELEDLSIRFASGDLDAHIQDIGVEELEHLTGNMHEMAGRLKDLMNSRVEDQKKLRAAEMKALQEQIKPHFLYNTLDSIVWLAQQEETEEVIEITMALTSFFRIVLSSGKDYIPVSREIEQVENYLKIQSIRYGSILNYRIEADEEILECNMLKLLLQPLVENAIYHGIKRKRTRGTVSVRCRKDENGRMVFSVSDDGVGMQPEELENLRAVLRGEGKPDRSYGLRNVNARLKLSYPDSGLQVESRPGEGTQVMFSIPCEFPQDPSRSAAAGKETDEAETEIAATLEAPADLE